MARFGWRPYVPVAARRARAQKEMAKLRKKGVDIRPVDIEGRKIARTFWGQAWCDHLEKFSDYANRLPRGRTYVRNGSVCHLEVSVGEIKAMVMGSEIYNVTVNVKKLPAKKWRDIRTRCAGQIGSLLELLQGRISESVMEIVTDRDRGLFPLPKEISLDCDCPDWAVMCKHVAAVLYGVGARLDEKPELIFLLRGVDHDELISAEAAVAATVAGASGSKRKRIADGDLADVFGIEITEEHADHDDRPTASQSAPKAGPRPRRKRKSADQPKSSRSRRTRKAKSKGRAAERSPRKGRAKKKKPAIPRKASMPRDSGNRSVTGKTVARKRAKFNMSQSHFAKLLGVSPPTIGNWEKKKGRLNLQTRTLNAWIAVVGLTEEEAWERLNDEAHPLPPAT